MAAIPCFCQRMRGGFCLRKIRLHRKSGLGKVQRGLVIACVTHWGEECKGGSGVLAEVE